MAEGWGLSRRHGCEWSLDGCFATCAESGVSLAVCEVWRVSWGWVPVETGSPQERRIRRMDRPWSRPEPTLNGRGLYPANRVEGDTATSLVIGR